MFRRYVVTAKRKHEHFPTFHICWGQELANSQYVACVRRGFQSRLLTTGALCIVSGLVDWKQPLCHRQDPPVAQLVERSTVASVVIERSLVRIRAGGFSRPLISNGSSFYCRTESATNRLDGATVARLTPDQTVGRSNRSRVIFFHAFAIDYSFSITLVVTQYWHSSRVVYVEVDYSSGLWPR